VKKKLEDDMEQLTPASWLFGGHGRVSPFVRCIASQANHKHVM
jgi:hypothetical protein